VIFHLVMVGELSHPNDPDTSTYVRDAYSFQLVTGWVKLS